MHACFVVSNAFALNAFLAGPIEALAADGWRITVVLNTADGQPSDRILRHATVKHVAIARDIAPWRDAAALVRLWRLLGRGGFDTVHSVTPKAGLLAMLAGRAARIPVRMHTFTGQVWATRTGPMRWLLRSLDALLAASATSVLADSPSQRDFLAAENVARWEHIGVLGEGSICGVDVGRFRPDPVARAAVRADLGLADGDIAVLYLGRLHRDKGLAELGDAFAKLAARRPALHLLLAGPDEGALALLQNATLAFRDRVHVIGLTREPQKYMAAADVFCLPSYREGFGLSLLEAAAAGVPCVASRIYGITDAVEDGVTGLLVPVRDAAALAEGLRRLVDDPDLRARMGEAARLRATRRFSSGVLLAAWRELYSRQASRPRG